MFQEFHEGRLDINYAYLVLIRQISLENITIERFQRVISHDKERVPKRASCVHQNLHSSIYIALKYLYIVPKFIHFHIMNKSTNLYKFSFSISSLSDNPLEPPPDSPP